jgi:hypothetical protein
MAQSAPAEIRPAGDELRKHPVSLVRKLEPVTRTVVPPVPSAGNKETVGVTRNVAVPLSPAAVPITVTVERPGVAPVKTVNEPVSVPDEIVQRKAALTADPPIVQAESSKLKPDPLTVIVAVTGPKLGLRVTTCGTTSSVVDACTPVAFKVRRSLTALAAFASVRVPVTRKVVPSIAQELTVRSPERPGQ